MNFQPLVYSIFAGNENQRVLNDLYGQIERDQSSHRGGNLIYTGAIRDPHAPICFRLDGASEISGFSTCNSIRPGRRERERERVAFPRDPANRTEVRSIGSRLYLGSLLSLKTCNEAFVMRAIRMQMLVGLLLQDGPRRDDFDLYSIERDPRFERGSTAIDS